MTEHVTEVYIILSEISLSLQYQLVLFSFWRDSSQWARASSFTRYLDHTQPRATVGRTSLDE